MPPAEIALADEFKTALRGMASSVTLITTGLGGARYGMVATAVMSVSMEPPSLVIAVNKSASIHDCISERGYFCVNLLSEWDMSLTQGFAAAKGEARFAYGAWLTRTVEGEGGNLPFLSNAQAAIFCATSQSHSHGTHTLFVGNVIKVIRSDDQAPLVYCSGQYGAFEELPSALAKAAN